MFRCLFKTIFMLFSLFCQAGNSMATTWCFPTSLKPQTLVYLQLLGISVCTKSNLEQRAACTEFSSEYIEMQRDCIIAWKLNSKHIYSNSDLMYWGYQILEVPQKMLVNIILVCWDVWNQKLAPHCMILFQNCSALKKETKLYKPRLLRCSIWNKRFSVLCHLCVTVRARHLVSCLPNPDPWGCPCLHPVLCAPD